MKRFLPVALVAGLAPHASQAQEMRLLRFPAIHGDTVVFTYASDLWSVDRKGGTARRLTTHPGDEIRARISPDGSRIAFRASYDGDPDVYVMPVEGGPPTRLTYDPVGEIVVGWTPDGKVAYSSSADTYDDWLNRLWLVEPTGGLPYETPLRELSNGSFFADGKRIAYNRTDAYRLNWRRYRGGYSGRISLYNLATNTYSELPGGRENSWFPMVVGETIYYVSDRNLGTVNLYRHDLTTGKDTQLTRYSDADIKWPNTDGRTIVYEHDGSIHAYDIATGKDENLKIQVKSDELAARPHLQKLGKRIANFSLSPGGARVAVEARGEVFNVSADGKEVRNLTGTTGVRERWPQWSPDGKTVAYLSDASGEFQIVSQPVSGGKEKQLSRHQGPGIRGFAWSPDGRRIVYWTEDARLVLLSPETGEGKQFFRSEYGGWMNLAWSPDSRWIAFNAPGANDFSSIYLYEVPAGAVTRVTDGFYDDRNVCFDLSGKYLYFTSPRTFAPTSGRFEESLKVENADRVYVLPLASDLLNPLFPKPKEDGGEEEKKDKEKKEATARVRIDLDGLAGRAVVLPLPAGDVGQLFCGDNGVFHYDQGKLRKFDLASRETQMIYEGPEINLAFTRDRSKLAYYGEDTLGVSEIKPGLKHGAGKVDTDALEAWVEPKAMWRQMLWDAWRFERDNFFREDMWGLDWLAVGKRYEQYLPYVSHWSDMKYVLGLMLGELGTSHAVVGDPAGEPPPAGVSAAGLGADYERSGQWVRFARIYPGTLAQDSLRGPLGEPGLGVKAGDYLLEIDGRPVDASVHPSSLLINKANRIVTLTVNDRPSLEGARRIQVRPLAAEAGLRYYEWVEENRRKVDQLSGGRIGYIHYPNTMLEGQTEFIRGYWAQSDKEAIILDGRFNSGGFPQPMVLPTLGRRRQTVIRSRNWRGGSEINAINGPKAMLINGYAGSGGDLTPWMFRDAGLGVLIGTRTMGALVGIQEYRTLMNGGFVSAPAYTRFEPATGEWIAENKGIEPDIEVDARPDLIAQGRDPQLEKAVEVLLEELEKNPLKTVPPKLPPPPGGR